MNEQNRNNQYLLTPVREDNSNLSWADIILVLLKNIKLLILTPVAFMVIAVGYVLFIAKPVYVSTSTLLPTGGNDALSEIRGFASQFGFSLPGAGESEDFSSREMYIKILQSKTLAASLLDKSFDTEEYGENMALLDILATHYSYPAGGGDSLRSRAINSLLENIISVHEDKKSSLLTLKVATSDPQFSANLNNAILKELDTLQQEFRLKRVSEKKTFIENRVNTVQGELEASEERLMRFREQNRQIGNSPTLLLEQERLSREIQVQTGVFTTLKQQLEMTKIELVQTESLIQVLDPPNVPIKSERPRKRLAVVFSGFLGGLLALTFAFIRNAVNNSSQTESAKFAQIRNMFRF